jgi:hypothetical protein
VPGTIQGAWTPELGIGFADMIRYMVNQDPDILVVGEIDGKETMEAVVEAGLTGAKVLTSYPAFDATGALLRMNRLGLENYLIAASSITVLSQRLVRCLCQSCRQPHVPDQAVFNRLGLVDVPPESFTFYKPVGCAECNQHGYKGQLAIHELLQINEAIREAILDHKPAATIRGIARTEAKLVSMAEDGLYKAIEGMMSIATDLVKDPVVLSVHSMTPEMNGVLRTWPIALSSHEDKRLSTPMLAALRQRIGLEVGDNQPYALDPKEDYSVPHHAMRRGLRHLQVEFRQDLVATEEGALKWAKLFGDSLAEVLGL